MKWIFAALMYICFHGVAEATETIVVRSGDHQGFTRLVFGIEEGSDWSIKTEGRNARIKIDAENVRFDTGAVFSKIGRNRIKALRQESAGDPLEVSLNCRCSITGFVHGGRWLVVDISEGADNQAPDEIASPISFDFVGISGVQRYKFWLKAEETENELLKADGAEDETKSQSDSSRIARNLSLNEIVPMRKSMSPALELLDPSFGGVGNLEGAIREQIERHEDLGISLTTPPNSQAQTTSSRNTNEEPSRNENFSISASSDELSTSLASNRANREVGSIECIESTLLDVIDSGDPTDFPERVARLRSRLTKEFDNVDRSAALQLARTYLGVGFGAEGKQAAALAFPDNEETSILRSMAEIIDGQTSFEDNVFKGMQACDGAASFWSAMSEQDLQSDANHAAILQEFEGLPSALKLQMGPRLAKVYLGRGMNERAGLVLRAMERSTSEISPELQEIDISVSEASNDPASANFPRVQLLGEQSDVAIRSLVKLIETSFENGAPMTPEALDLVESYRIQFRKTAYGPDLRRANLFALLLSGDFESSLDLTREIERADGAEALSNSMNFLLESVVDSGSDVDFLKIVMNLGVDFDAPPPEDLRLKISRRLLDLGFFAAATRFVSGFSDGQTSSDQRILQAESALGRELPREALVSLLGLNDSRSNSIRAQAMAQLGQYERAATLLDDVGNTSQASRNRWLAGVFDSTADQVQSPYSEIINSSETLLSSESASEEKGSLAEARTLVAESEKTCQGISDILDMLSDLR